MPFTKFREDIETSQRNISELQKNLKGNAVPGGALAQMALQELETAVEELRVAEEEMRAQNEELLLTRQRVETERQRYQDLFQDAPDGYLITDLSGVILEANRAASHLLNLSPRYLTGKPLSVFVSEEYRREFYADHLQTNLRQQQKEWEVRLQPRRRKAFDAFLTVAPALDPQGRSAGLRWLIRDATERKAAEEERYQNLVQSVKDYAIFTLDAAGYILSWNDGAERIIGYAESEIIGKNIAVLFSPEDQQAGTPERERAVVAAEGRAEDVRWHVRKDGTLLWCDGVLTALRDEKGSLISYAKVMRDFTERKHAEEKQAVLYAREHYIAETFQRALLTTVPSEGFPGLSVATIYAAALEEAQVGGDFYDTFALEDGLIALVLGDVSGKGLRAALFASEIKSALRLALREYPHPARTLSRVNEFVCDAQRLDERQDNQFVTLVLAVIHPATGALSLSVAGAEPPLLLRSGAAEAVASAQAPMLGVIPRQEFSTLQLELAPDDTLVLVTDGITEARRGADFLDYDGLITLALQPPPTASLEELGQAILSGARTFAGGPLADDACLLLARRT